MTIVSVGLQIADSLGSTIGESFDYSTSEDETNRERLKVSVTPTEQTFLFTPVGPNESSILVLHCYALIDATNGDAATKLQWGYATGNYDHELNIGETSVVRLITGHTYDRVFMTSSLSDVWVDCQIWSQ